MTFMDEELRELIGHAVRNVLARACETFLADAEMDNDEFTALAYVITDSVTRLLESRHPPAPAITLSSFCEKFRHNSCPGLKFCGCACHVDHTDPQALRSWMAQHRECGNPPPRNLTEFAERQREDLINSLTKDETTP